MSLRRSTSRAAVLALAAGLLASITAPPAQADDAVAGGQAASPPDSLFPNQGNSGYDVGHYDIAFSIDVGISPVLNGASTTTIDATTTVSATTTGAPLSSYSFDFQGTSTTLAASTLTVDAVSVNGVPATFSRIEDTTIPNATTDKHKLVVTPATPVSGAFTTVVEYSGQPVSHRDTDNSIEGWNNTVDGATFVNQPVGSMTLFPNNNTPRDKATYTWTVDAPSMLRTSNFAQAGGKPYQAAVVSNGELVSKTPTGDGSRTTWVWDQSRPMASELSLFSIGRYDMYTSDITLASGRTIPEWTFIDPAISVANQTTTLGTRAQLKAMLDFFESKYGPYPGGSTGLVTDNTTGINYALETQDRPFFPNSAGRGTTYHEVMHQWWGDAVQPTDWNDIWLNEGPATYSEAQFPFEGAGSTTTSTEQSRYAAWNSSNPTGSVWTTPPANMTLASQLFGSQVYDRGSWTLEALRTAIGAADYETVMRTWQTRYGGGETNVRRTAQFIALAEEVSGRNLTAFFQAWLYGTTKAPWPVKFNLDVSTPSGQVNPGDAVSYVVSARNTGKVAMPVAGTVVTLDLADVLDDATIGTLPAGVTQDGTTLTWTVPATALAATSSVTVPVTVNAGTDGATLRPVARAATLGGTCVVCAPSTVVGLAPIALAPAPGITGLTGGAPVVGQALTATTTLWSPGTTFAYQWLVDGTPVPGATQESWTPTGEVIGLPVTVRVTGTLAGSRDTTATSAATSAGVRGTPASSAPTITGTPKIGEKLTAHPGAWQPGTVFTYQWQANGVNITGATGPVYAPSLVTQIGQAITVIVTGTRYGYTTTSRTSLPAGLVLPGDLLSLTPVPTLPATVKVGTPVTAIPGFWDDGVLLTYQWQANGTNIPGATAVAYTPTAAQLGQALTVTVTGTKLGILAVSVPSLASTIAAGTQVLQPLPTITGTPRAGTAVTGVPGTWDAGTTLGLQWYVDGVAVPGATTTSFTPTTADIGKALTFQVTSVRAGYATVTRTSAAGTVLAQLQVLTPTPTVLGTPKVGGELTAVPGTWDDGTTLAFQWLADGTPVDGATSSTYTPGAGQLGSALAVRITSTKVDFEDVVRTSDLTAAVAKGDLVSTPLPTITGTPKVDVELTAVPGVWDAGTLLSYQWYADGTPVDGATSSTWTPGPGRVGSVVTVAVSGVKTGFEEVTRTSLATVAVVEGDLLSTPLPTITGTPKVGVQLTAVPGTWDLGVDLGYQWYADGDAIDGATSSTYVPGPGRAGDVITVAVTGAKTGYETVVRTSAATTAVLAGDLSSTPVPTITGTPKVGVPLTAVPGTWDAGSVLGFQWLADGQPVAGATTATFTPGAAQQGDVVTVEVTGTLAGFVPVTQVSLPTAVVALGDLTSTPVPTVTGAPKVAVPLTAVPGTWDAGTALGFQWLADGLLVPGATAATFTPGAAQQGRVLTVEVTGTLAGFLPVTKASLPTAAVALGDLVATPVPTITGTPKVDRPLTVVTGAWDAGTALAYQWSVGGTPVAGATGSTYVARAEDAGKAVTVAVTGTLAGYAQAVRSSAPSGAVAAGDLASAPAPTVIGTPRVDQELRADPGTWDAGTAFDYRWTRDGVPISGATGTTYRATAADLGRSLAVVVTGSKAGYTSLSRSSAGSVVVAATQVLQPKPVISGKARVGRTLRARPGTHDAGVTITYLWRSGSRTVGTGRTLELRTKLVGTRIRLTTTATKPGWTTVVARSARTGKVLPRA